MSGLFRDLIDNFDNSSLSSKFSTFLSGAGSVVETGGGIKITPESSVAGSDNECFSTGSTYDLTGNYVKIKVPQVLNANANTETSIFLKLDDNNLLRMNVAESPQTVNCHKIVSGVYTLTGWTNYNATNHLWWCIRERGGTIYWDTSPTGANNSWTNVGSVATPFAITDLALLMVGYANNVASPGFCIFDELNCIPKDDLPPNIARSITVGDGMSRSEGKI